MKGVYILVLNVNKTKIRVGSLGEITFKGRYAYVGSAQNNLEKRIKRHLSDDKKWRWHIDYLLALANVEMVFVKSAKKSEECATAKQLEMLYEPVIGFGSSDCKCKSHLFKIPNLQDFIAVVRDLGFDFYV